MDDQWDRLPDRCRRQRFAFQLSGKANCGNSRSIAFGSLGMDGRLYVGDGRAGNPVQVLDEVQYHRFQTGVGARMTTNYDEGHVAEQYKKVKEQPWRSRVETYSLMKLLGDLRGKHVVDLACGEGYFTRKLRQGGAAKVLGIDLSERMIDLARAQEAGDPLGIEYRVGDARAIVPPQEFDLAVASWLLVYAHDRAELARMCQGLACWLRPGGRFVTFTTNPEVYFFNPPADYRKYGFQITLADHVYEGAPILWSAHMEGSDLQVENYYLPVAAYEAAFTEAGFRAFNVHPLELGPDPQGADDREYWRDFLKTPVAILIDCVKTWARRNGTYPLFYPTPGQYE